MKTVLSRIKNEYIISLMVKVLYENFDALVGVFGLILNNKLTIIVKVAFHLFFSPGLASNFACFRSDSLTKSPLQSQVTLGFGLA